MDILSDVLRTHTAGAVFLARHDYYGRWGIGVDDEGVAGLHYVEQGQCYLRVDGETPVLLSQGDVVLMPRGDPHALSAQRRGRITDLSTFLARPPVAASDPPDARIVCAAQKFCVERSRFHPLLWALPKSIHIPATTIVACPTLGPCLRLLLAELRGETPGRAAVVDLLLGAFLVYAIRNWLHAQPQTDGWVGALRDPRIGRALEAIHSDPAHEWTVAKLAGRAGLSRPAFAKRFRATVTEPPLGYVTRVRMSEASRLLRTTDDQVAEIARQVGYASEFAFSRAFKRSVGASPSHFRQSSRDSP